MRITRGKRGKFAGGTAPGSMTGSNGIFGQWIADEDGLPAYDYKLDQHDDRRARYINSERLDRRDHWFLIGNDRISGLVSNDGIVQLYMADRGGIFLNHYDPSLELDTLDVIRASLRIIISDLRHWLKSLFLKKELRERVSPGPMAQMHALRSANKARTRAITPESYVGGYAYLDDGEEFWATAYRYRPTDGTTNRVYGTGYFKTDTLHRGVHVERKVYAPASDVPFVIADVTVANTTDAPKTVKYYEYWDINIHQMKLQWLRAGAFAPRFDAERRMLNGLFPVTIESQPENAAIRFHQATPSNAPDRERVEPVNWYPPDVFLADLSGTPDAYYRYTDDFFGTGGAADPEAVAQRRDPTDKLFSPSPMPYCMVIRRDLQLAPGESIKLRFAYGAADRDQPDFDFLQAYRTVDLWSAQRQYWKDHLVAFTTPDAPELQREMIWNSYSVLASTVYNEFFDVHIPPQGSAYLFLHGADGVPRDYALFAMSLAYIKPSFAKDLLRMVMQMRDATTHQIGYAISGHGYINGGDVHEKPSDLDLFFLLGLCEYLAATGDTEFLQESVRLYPRINPRPVSDHIVIAVEHLINTVGRGENGLIRISDGDWSDGVVISNVLRFPPRVSLERTIANGESLPNSQMALYILPRVALLLEESRPEVAAKIRQFVSEVEIAVSRQWKGRWYTRAILRGFRNEPILLGDQNIDLESQPWALISGAAERQGVSDTLIDTIRTELDDPSPIGAPLTANGAVWPAISQLLTWGYVHYRPDLAWRSFRNHTFGARAAQFPEIWFNIWTSPDGINTPAAAQHPGGTWSSPATPMTDFPAMNNNQHTMSLLALLRVCGIEPLANAKGLRIAPHTPGIYTLDLPLLKLDVTPDRITGEYRPIISGVRELHLCLASKPTTFAASIDGQEVNALTVDGDCVLHLTLNAGQPIQFEVVSI